jgi:HSP20 family molecular chaperone IbpA
MAIAGFSPQEVDVTQQGNTLTVTGQKTDDQDHEASEARQDALHGNAGLQQP